MLFYFGNVCQLPEIFIPCTPSKGKYLGKDVGYVFIAETAEGGCPPLNFSENIKIY